MGSKVDGLKIAILGAGNVGGALGRGWSRVGHTIAYGVVDPGTAKHGPIADAAGGAEVATVLKATIGADVVVLALPFAAVPGALEAAGDLAGRVIVDVTNPMRMGSAGLELAMGFDASAAEQVARLAPGASVYKTLNQVGFEVMEDTGRFPIAPLMFVAGDDDGRKPLVLGMVADLGFHAVDAGGLKAARLLEPLGALWIHMAINREAGRDVAFAFSTRGEASRP
ncbi:NADPH-dependent F420 reductase [Acidisphaera sp. L21]|uniref:NADPH-dependent F420 reductase n=1 Tax=Acidisphaera sp. L21 TaxID=1641851 RepID=UPI001C205B4A|nr:NAD(P)-binding domain-containing protein [Acidisphaera sp. L21]